MPTVRCPKCHHARAWKLRRQRLKCKRCRSEFGGVVYPVVGFRVSTDEWTVCIRTFLRERTIRRVTEETNRSHCLVERMVMHLRVRMASDVRGRCAGPVEMDETYIGGQRKNKRLHIRRIGAKKGHGTDKLPIVGVYDRPTGTVLVFVEPRKLDIAFIIRTLKTHTVAGAKVYTDGFKMYRSLSTHGFFHAYIDHDGGEYVRGDVHTNNIEGFWGIMKRKLGCIGGMQRKYLHLFVAEIVWKFNHRHLSLKDQERMLAVLILGS